jgi:hypothetical protein
MSELSDKLGEISGLNLTAKHVRLVEVSEKEPWEHDLWDVVITYNGKTYTTEYSTGMGHRKVAPGVETFYQGGRKKYATAGSVAHTETEAAKKNFTKPVAPVLADVISSIVMDAGSAEDTFEDWCDNLGFDSDSRKALETYMKCQEARSKFLKVFGSEFLEEVRYLEH